MLNRIFCLPSLIPLQAVTSPLNFDCEAEMKFQHVLSKGIEGTTMFGLSLDPLHSTAIDRDALKQWVETLANSLSFMDDAPIEGPAATYRNSFLTELQAYCLYVASCDGPITEDTLSVVNWLTGQQHTDLTQALDLLREANSDGWTLGYPATFKALVCFVAGNDEGILPAGEIYHFYHQVARFVYSLEHSDEFDEARKARSYVDAFRKYVERVSAIGFRFPPENESTISDVRKEWERLVQMEHDELKKGAVGSWKCVSGDALSSGALSDIVLSDDGRGNMGRKIAFWKVIELPGTGGQAPVMLIPDIGANIVLLPLDNDRMVATVYSNDPRLHLKSALYQRDRGNNNQASFAQRNVSRSATVSRSTTTSTSRAADVTPKKPASKAPWLIAAAVIAAVWFGIYNFSIKPSKMYEQAKGYYDSGLYQMAANTFGELGDYKDSDAMEQKALLGVAAQEAEENAGKSPKAWDAAAQAYKELGDRRGRTKARTCRNYASYYRGTRLMAKGNWKSAKKAFGKIKTKKKSFEDVPELLVECDTHIAYEKAEALFAEGDYYEAYVKFKALEGSNVEGIPDLSERAQACLQDFPEHGVTYTHPDYVSSAVPLTINNRSGNTYFKIYNDSGDVLVMTIFIREGNSITVTLPAGTYQMNEAHGDLWFGEKDMFGDGGHYFHCKFDGEDNATLQWGYRYEISTTYGFNFSGTGIQNEEVDKDSF